VGTHRNRPCLFYAAALREKEFMQTYSERSTQLALDASVAVLVLTNAQCDDLEFLSLKPRQIPESTLLELRTHWAGRGLRSVGIIGLVGTSPRCALKEELEPEQISALAGAFLAYLHVLFAGSFAEQQAGAETAELCRMWSLEDPRPEKFN
jgi:hypothetical protein